MNFQEDLLKCDSRSNGNIVQINHEFSQNTKPILQKSQTNIGKLSSMLAMHQQKMKDNNNNNSNNINNNNTISDNALMNQKNNLKKSETSTLNGILKNGTTKFSSNTIAIQNGHTKNISFGDIGK